MKNYNLRTKKQQENKKSTFLYETINHLHPGADSRNLFHNQEPL